MLLILFAMAAASPNPSSIDAPRRNFAACIRQFEKQSLSSKMLPDAYSAAVKAACASEADALTHALVAYDVAMGNKRDRAAQNAASDVADYRDTSIERYRDSATPQ